MLVWGISMPAARVLVLGFAMLACVYLFRLVEHTHDSRTATAATLVFAASPVVFRYSRQIMLDVPALAWGLVATYYLVRYLETERRRDLALTAAAAVAMALTRFSALYLLPLSVLALFASGKWGLLRRRDVWLTVLSALAVVAPVYVYLARTWGWVYRVVATRGIDAEDTSGSVIEGASFYLGQLPGQLGWPALALAVVGLALALVSARRPRSWPYLAIALATLCSVAPWASRGARYAIYWVPAFALFAVTGIAWLSERSGKRALFAPLATLLVLATAGISLQNLRPFVRGYEKAARYVLANSGESAFCLVDAGLSGNFVYQIRRHDPHRGLRVLRADRILYSVVLTPDVSYQGGPEDDQEVLGTVFRYDPALILVEEPRAFSDTAAAQSFRRVIASNGERFRLEKVIAVVTNRRALQGIELKIYRSLVRNPDPEESLEIDVPGLGLSLRERGAS